MALEKYIYAINEGMLLHLNDEYMPELIKIEKRMMNAETEIKRTQASDQYMSLSRMIEQYIDGVVPVFNNLNDLEALFEQGNFVTAFYPANRKTNILRAKGVEDIRLKDFYGIQEAPGELLHKYMIHLKPSRHTPEMRGIQPMSTESRNGLTAFWMRCVFCWMTIQPHWSTTTRHMTLKFMRKGEIRLGLTSSRMDIPQ